MTSTDRTVSRAWPACALGGWSAAWVAGRCSPDDVADTLAMFGSRHVVDDRRDGRSDSSVGVLGLLSLLRGARYMSVRLPAPGDPHGLPPGPATQAAYGAGEVLLVDGPGLSIPTSGAATGPVAVIPEPDGDGCRWIVHRYPAPLPVDPVPSVGEIEHQLRQSVSEATALIGSLGTLRVSGPSDLRGTLRTLTLRHQVELPPHDDARATRIIDSAAQVEAIVTMADSGGVSFGSTSGQLHAGDGELRRLVGLAHTARAAAVNRVIAEHLPVER